MATFAARRLQGMISNTANILGIELLAAAQGIEFLRPLKSSTALEAVHALLRKDVPAHNVDRYLAPDMAHATTMVRNGTVASVVRNMSGLPKLWVPV
jgi:histidine ammonia-lyase